jgi:hypothetical protein
VDGPVVAKALKDTSYSLLIIPFMSKAKEKEETEVLERSLHALAGAQSFPSSAMQAFEISATPSRIYGRRTLASARAKNAV